MLANEHIQNQVIEAILNERRSQQAKWGEQNHKPGRWKLILDEELGEMAKACLENDDDQYIKELIEAAAVMVAWIECEIRNKSTDG